MINKKLSQYLDSKKAFKLVLGANNSNYSEIEKLTALYSSIGARFFDIEASIEAYNALIKGLEYSSVNREDVFVCISVGANQDPHLRKFRIDKNDCINCKKCINFCPQNAIVEKENNNKTLQNNKTKENSITIEILQDRCIGCSKCFNSTSCNALKSYQKIRNWQEFLPQLFPLVDCIEFHIISDDIKEIDEKWDYLCSNYSGMLSICLDRSCFGDKKIIEQLNKMIDTANKEIERKIIIQADGAPMSAGKNDYKTTLQTVAFAHLINKNNIDSYILLSGGTNSKTSELAKLLDIDFNGVSFGSYARKIVKEYCSSFNFLEDSEKFKKAQTIALELFKTLNSKFE